MCTTGTVPKPHLCQSCHVLTDSHLSRLIKNVPEMLIFMSRDTFRNVVYIKRITDSGQAKGKAVHGLD